MSQKRYWRTCFMNKKEKIRQYYTYKGKVIMSFYISKSEDGYVAGPRIKGVNKHLTVLKDQKRISWHITDKSNQDQKKKRGETSNTDVGLTLANFLGGALMPYDKEDTCWIISVEKMNQIITKDKVGNEFIAIDKGLEEIKFHFEEEKYWIEHPINGIRSKNTLYGFKKDNGEIRVIIPINDSYMLSYPLSIIPEVLTYIKEKLGISQFLNYLEEKMQIEEKVPGKTDSKYEEM